MTFNQKSEKKLILPGHVTLPLISMYVPMHECTTQNLLVAPQWQYQNVLICVCPEWNFWGILFLSCLSVCQSVCLSVCGSVTLWQKNFNLGHNFWTVRDKDFIFGIHTQLMKSFQMIPRSMKLLPWLLPLFKKANLGLCGHRGHLSFTSTPVFIVIYISLLVFLLSSSPLIHQTLTDPDPLMSWFRFKISISDANWRCFGKPLDSHVLRSRSCRSNSCISL